MTTINIPGELEWVEESESEFGGKVFVHVPARTERYLICSFRSPKEALGTIYEKPVADLFEEHRPLGEDEFVNSLISRIRNKVVAVTRDTYTFTWWGSSRQEVETRPLKAAEWDWDKETAVRILEIHRRLYTEKPHEARDADGLVIDMTRDQVRDPVTKRALDVEFRSYVEGHDLRFGDWWWSPSLAKPYVPTHPASDPSQLARLQEIWERKTKPKRWADVDIDETRFRLTPELDPVDPVGLAGAQPGDELHAAMLACDVAGKRLMAVMGKRPTWETIDKLPKVRTRPVVIASGCNAMPWQAHDQFPPSWATHFIFAPEGE